MNPWWRDTFFRSDPPFAPFYEDASVVLFNCDCRELMPHLNRYDVLLTDFPYGMSWMGNHRIVPLGKIVGDEKADYETLAKFIDLANVAAYTFCRWDNLMELPKEMKPKSFITWVKNNWGSGDLEHEYGRQTESVAFWAKADHAWRTKRPADVVLRSRVHSATLLHPSEKPVDVFTPFLQHNVGSTMVDPYCGAGASLVAAKMCGYKALGVDIVQDYCQKASDRLRQDFLL